MDDCLFFIFYKHYAWLLMTLAAQCAETPAADDAACVGFVEAERRPTGDEYANPSLHHVFRRQKTFIV